MLEATQCAAGAVRRSVFRNLLRRLPYPVWAVLISAVCFTIVGVAHVWKGVPIGYLTQDPTTVGDVASYAGFLSNVGVMFWTATAALCLFTGWLLPVHLRTDLRSFLLAAGALTLLLAVDDVFRFHETIFPRQIGLPEPLVHVLYAALALLFTIRFHARVFSAEGRLLFTAMAFLASSQALDMLEWNIIDPFILEDGFKFFGIVCWFFYFLRVCWLGLKR